MDSGPLVRSASTIREVSPATTSFEFGPSSTPIHAWLPPQESALREYLRVLIKRKWTVLGCLAAIFSIVAIASFKQTPIYEAMGRIAINKPDYTLTNFKDSSGGGSDYADPTDMDTEVTILQSDLLALHGARRCPGARPPAGRLCPYFVPAGRLQRWLASGAQTQHPHRRDPLRKHQSAACGLDRQHARQYLHRAELQDQVRIHHAGLRLVVKATGRPADEGRDLPGKAGQVPEGTRNPRHR